MVITDISEGPRLAAELAVALVRDLREHGCEASTESTCEAGTTVLRIAFDPRHGAVLTFTPTANWVLVSGTVSSDGAVVEDLGHEKVLFTGWPDAKVHALMGQVRRAADRLATPSRTRLG
jgi:hypothetical protein